MLNRRKDCLHGKWSEINSPMSCFSSSIATLCVFFYRRAMPSSSPHFRCFMFIAMPVGQNISLEIVVFSGTVIGVIDSSQLQGKVAQSHLAYQTSFIFVRQGISSRRVAWC